MKQASKAFSQYYSKHVYTFFIWLLRHTNIIILLHKNSSSAILKICNLFPSHSKKLDHP